MDKAFRLRPVRLVLGEAKGQNRIYFSEAVS